MNIIKKINKNRLVNQFIEFAKINSESGHEREFAKYLFKTAQNLGYSCWIDDFLNVYVKIDSDSENSLVLNTHMDTVMPGKNIIPKVINKNNEDYIISSGNTILGADPKATIAALFEILNIIAKNKLRTKQILLSFTCQEEQGIPTADKINTDIKYCIVPDRGAPLGEIRYSAPFAQVFEVEIKGKASYATTNFNLGRHAIQSAADMINKLKIGEFAPNSAANIGIINGGLMTSVVPDNCSFKGNCYSFSKSEFDNFFLELNKVVAKADSKYGTKSEIIMHEYFEGFDLGKNHELVKLAYDSIKKTGINPVYKEDMAVSNANILNSIGIESVLISYGAENCHTTDEKISVSTLVKLTEILMNLIIE